MGSTRLCPYMPFPIGIILFLGRKSSVFGTVKKGEIENAELRSHGSLHEGLVPFISNRKVDVNVIPLIKMFFKSYLDNICLTKQAINP